MVSTTKNIKGTLNSSFTVGKNGSTLYQGSVFPDSSIGVAGDLFVYKNGSDSQILQKQGSVWANTTTRQPIATQYSLFVGRNDEVPLLSSATYNFNITGIRGIKTTTGSISASFLLNGLPIAGLTGVNVTSTPQNINTVGVATVLIGDRLSLMLSSNNDATKFEVTIAGTKL